MNEIKYNFFSRLLHRVSLGSKAVSEISFDIENAIYLKKNLPLNKEGNHVFITGLARSGTTALMQTLYDTKVFASLTYDDMPFILAPNLGEKFAKKQKIGELKERAHKDGIYINNESPEALDEVFWKVFLDNNYIKKDRLLKNKISTEIAAKFNNYIELILIKNYKSIKLRYLSKNNNNILRLDSLLQKFPNSKIIIPFRNPLQHALSLLNQHNHFCEIQQEDPFSLKYMNWIGHHEFGLNQKPFYFGNDEEFDRLVNFIKEDINYWLLIWLNYYRFVLEKYSDSCILFSYEKFCENPSKTMNNLAHKIDLEYVEFKLDSFNTKTRTFDNFDKQIMKECLDVYSKLSEY